MSDCISYEEMRRRMTVMETELQMLRQARNAVSEENRNESQSQQWRPAEEPTTSSRTSK